MAVMSAERRLGNVVVMHTDLKIPAAQVQLGEVCSAVELIQELLHNGDREHVPHCLRVQRLVVDAKPPAVVLLANEEDGRGERRCAGANDALL